jgi:hypothetical protein
MRSWKVALLSLAFACSPGVDFPSRAPEVPDGNAALLAHDVTMDSLKPNPRPESWMVGCFDIVSEALLRGRPPEAIQLTETKMPMRPNAMWTSYRVHSLDPSNPERQWSWEPIPGGRLRIHLTDESSGWAMELARMGTELTGDLQAVSDVPPLIRDPTRVRLVGRECP